MKTKTIFKTLALAMMMPAMLLTTACSSDDDAIANNPENNNQKGYAIPVTVNVTRQGDATTRAEYNESTKELAFSAGDQLFVQGTDNGAGAFAGTLAWQSGDTFSGTIYTTNEYSGAANALLASASSATATLLPAGYEDYEYLTVSNPETCSASLTTAPAKAFATSKAAAVEQLSLEQATAYSNGFDLAPQNAILNFTTANGLGYMPEWLTPYTVSLQAGGTTITESVTPVQEYSNAVATFAMAVAGSATPSSLTLTVAGTPVSLGSHALTAGKIYNQKLLNIAAAPQIGKNEKWIVYGTASDKEIIVNTGAAVTLSDVNLSSSRIRIYDDATITLADGTTNTITTAGNYPAIQVSANKSLTIKGSGSLNVTGGSNNPAIGGMEGSNITIESTVHLTATAGEGQSKAISTNGGGTVTIGGVVYDGGAPSPFVYPAPAPAPKAAAEATAEDLGKVIGADGIIYDDAAAATAAGTTARAIIAYVGDGDTSDDTYNHGLAIAMSDANGGSKCQWFTRTQAMNCVSGNGAIATAIGYKDGIGNTNTLTTDGHTHAAATAAASNNGTAAPTGTSGWFLPSIGQWNLIVQGLATKKAGSAVTTNISGDENSTYTSSNLNSVITAAGGTGFESDDYHSSTLSSPASYFWVMQFEEGGVRDWGLGTTNYVRSVLAF